MARESDRRPFALIERVVGRIAEALWLTRHALAGVVPRHATCADIRHVLTRENTVPRHTWRH